MVTEYAEVRIHWYSSAESGRVTSVLLRATGAHAYKPHFRVGTAGDYLGVAFIDGVPSIAPPGAETVATVALIYEDTGVDYTPLVPHAHFDVLEGTRVIGQGTVVRRWHEWGDWRERMPG